VSPQELVSLIVRVAGGVGAQREQLPQLGDAEVSVDILFAVHYAGAQRLFVCLPLQDFLLNAASLMKFLFLLLFVFEVTSFTRVIK
jgi:hypothetical protein